MKWTPEQVATLHDMYANDATYADICRALGRPMQSVRYKIRCERIRGAMKALTKLRFAARSRALNGEFEVIFEDGQMIRKYPPRYAIGSRPQVGARTTYSHIGMEI